MAIIKKESLVDQLYNQIRNNIITLQLPLGSKLNVSELQQKYGVSSTPLREAINRLQAENLVDYQSNVGAKVILIEENDVYEIQDVTIALHSAAINLAMEHADHKYLSDEIGKEIENYINATTISEKVNSIFNIFGLFYFNCGNRRLEQNMISIQGQQLILRYIYGNAVGLSSDDEVYFSNIKVAVAKGDSEEIIKQLKAYTKKTTQTIIDALPNNTI